MTIFRGNSKAKNILFFPSHSVSYMILSNLIGSINRTKGIFSVLNNGWEAQK